MNWELIIGVVLSIIILVTVGVSCYIFGLKKGFKAGVDLIIKEVNNALKNGEVE